MASVMFYTLYLGGLNRQIEEVHGEYTCLISISDDYSNYSDNSKREKMC